MASTQFGSSAGFLGGSARARVLVALNIAGPSLIVAMSDPADVLALEEARMLTGYNIEPVVATKAAIEDAIERFYKPLPN
jgi:type IV pilus assembly protein PilB